MALKRPTVEECQAIERCYLLGLAFFSADLISFDDLSLSNNCWQSVTAVVLEQSTRDDKRWPSALTSIRVPLPAPEGEG